MMITPFAGCMLVEQNLWGADIKTFITNGHSVVECKNKCLKHAECTAFTYHKPSGRCWLKRPGHRHTQYDKNLISGFKSCYNGTFASGSKDFSSSFRFPPSSQ